MVKGRCSLVEGYEERKVPEADLREMFCHSAILVPVVAAGRPTQALAPHPAVFDSDSIHFHEALLMHDLRSH